jgi:amino acid transporter
MLMATIIQGMVYALSGAAIWKLRNEAIQNKFLWFRGSPYVAVISMLIFIYLAFIVILPRLNASVGFALAAVGLLTLLYIIKIRSTLDPKASKQG